MAEFSIPRVLGRLVAVDTSNPPGRNYRACCDILASELKRAGLEARILAIPESVRRKVLPGSEGYPRYNVLARLDVGRARTLHFNAHYDVVPADASAWRTPPFRPVLSGGWMSGRGTADMKGAIVSVLAALQGLRASGVRPASNLEVSFVCDEETGSELGAAWLVRRGMVRPDAAVVCEGGSGCRVCLGHNGVLWYECTVRGRAAHASTPEYGANAFEGICALGAALRRYGARLSRRKFLAPDGVRMRPTLNLGGVIGGSPGAKINTVPDLAKFTIDRRVLPGEDIEAADRELRECVRQAAKVLSGLRVELREIDRNEPCLVASDGPLPQAVAAAVRQERGRRPLFSISSGFNDMHWFAAEAGLPVVGYGPGGKDCHAANERTRLAEVEACARIYQTLMEKVG